VSVRDRLKGLTEQDEMVLRLVGEHLGSLAARDLKNRCAEGLGHSAGSWASRKRELTVCSSSRWAGALTKATHDHVKLPAPLTQYANAPHGRYILAGGVSFPHRGREWADRVEANRAVAYRIHLDAGRDRWYIDASWTRPPAPSIPIEAALAHGVIGVDTNADHLAAWHLDTHGNPVGDPHRFPYDLSGTAQHRDAQVRHALSQLLNWAKACGVATIAVEDLDFQAEKTREKHGRKRRFRQLISGMPTSKLRARLTSMADQTGIAVIAVDPATPARGAHSTGKSPCTPPPAGPAATMPRASPSADAPRDTRSGDGRHRPRTTGVMVRGIGPPRPNRVPLGVRKPAAPLRTVAQSHPPGQGYTKERGQPAHPKPFGCPLPRG
jgi:IS605 OrfB family transposase